MQLVRIALLVVESGHAKFSRRALAMAATLILMVSTSAFAQEVFKKTDDFSGVTHYFTKRQDANLEGGSFFSRRYVDFDLHTFSNTGGIFSLGVHTLTPDWIFIIKGQSLDLKLDGAELVHLTGEGSLNSREVLGDSVSENANYIVTLDELKKIAFAKKIDFRIYGDRQIITGSLPTSFEADASEISTFSIPDADRMVSGSQSRSGSPASTNQEVALSPPNGLKLGVHGVSIGEQGATALHMPVKYGFMIISVDPDTPAAQADLSHADVIETLNGKPLVSLDDMRLALSEIKPGSLITVRLWRGGAELERRIQF